MGGLHSKDLSEPLVEYVEEGSGKRMWPEILSSAQRAAPAQGVPPHSTALKGAAESGAPRPLSSRISPWRPPKNLITPVTCIRSW